LQLIIVFVPLLALRRWTWWRIQLPNADRQSASLNDRFSVRSILIWTFEIALFAGLLNYLQIHFPGITLVQSAGSGEEQTLGPKALEMLIEAVSISVATIPAIVAAWMILGRRWAVLIGAIAAVLAQAALAGIVFFMWPLPPGQISMSEQDIATIGGILFGIGLGSMLTYFILRTAGYRLARIRKAAITDTAAAALPESAAFSAKPQLSLRHQLQFAVALLVLSTACIAMGGRGIRFVRAAMQEPLPLVGQEWVDIGFGAHQHGASDTDPRPRILSLVLEDNMIFTEAQLQEIEQLGPIPLIAFANKSNPGPQLEMLCQLTQLTRISLANSGAIDAHLAVVGKMKGLTWLSLANSGIEGRGFVELAHLEQLETLDASHIPITDAALVHLHGLQSLKYVDLISTDVTAEGVQKLREALPQAEVRWE
jgi:hypothetical protein